MKNIIPLLFLFLAFGANAQDKKIAKPKIVEASCGQCSFGMKGKGCSLAVKIDSKPYFVDGAKIDDYGDAHAEDGLCSAIRQAEVTGTISNNRFAAASFKLLPDAKKKKKQ